MNYLTRETVTHKGLFKFCCRLRRFQFHRYLKYFVYFEIDCANMKTCFLLPIGAFNLYTASKCSAKQIRCSQVCFPSLHVCAYSEIYIPVKQSFTLL